MAESGGFISPLSAHACPMLNLLGNMHLRLDAKGRLVLPSGLKKKPVAPGGRLRDEPRRVQALPGALSQQEWGTHARP